MRLRTLMLLLAAVLLFTGTGYAQDPPAPPPPSADTIEQLRLTPEQRQKIRMIFEEAKTERQRINRQLRMANIALDQALDFEPIDQDLIEQRLNELAAAQSAQMRMRIQTELKIRRELRPEQLATLRQLRLQARDFMDAPRPRKQRPAAQGFRPNRRNVP